METDIFDLDAMFEELVEACRVPEDLLGEVGLVPANELYSSQGAGGRS